MNLRAPILAAVAAALLLSGCARPVGDFGRAAPDALHDSLMPALGKLRSTSIKQPASSFNLTDQERAMRDRVWRYFVSPHAFDWFGDIAVEMSRTGVLTPSRKPLKTNTYYAWLRGTNYASSTVRYTRLADDVQADIDMLPDTLAAICAVQAVDRQRGLAANGLPDLEDNVAENAAARQAENQAITNGFVRALDNRYESYSFALNHLLVETPHEQARLADARMSDLATFVGAADNGEFCTGPASRQPGMGSAPIQSRVLNAPTVSGS